MRVLTLLIALAMGAFSTSALASGPVGYWSFDEGTGTTAADSSNNGNTGTLTNSPTWASGKIGNALTFNGSTASVAVSGAGSLANLYTGGLTVMAWIKPTAAGGGTGGRIVDKDNNDEGWLFTMNGSTSVKFSSDQFATSQPTRISSATITLNTWQHVAATWDGSTNGANIHIYINGTLADGTSTNGSGAPYSDSTTPLTIGNRPTDNSRGFAGSIDDVRVYSGVLTAAQIQAIESDTQDPTAPTTVTATANSSSQITLAWSGATDNVGVTGYRIERCSGASCTSFVQVASATASPYADTGLVGSTSYSYRIRSTDAAGLLSPYSAIKTATTSAGGGGDTQPPSTPTNIGATAVNSSQINVSWTASTDNVGVTGYLLERCSGASCTSYAQIANVTTVSYSNTGLTAATSYSYRVRATDAAGNLSGYSSPVATASTPAAGDTQPPTAPTNLTATPGPAQSTLTWTASTDNVGVANYLIERCQGASCTSFTQIGSVSGTTTTYVDTSVTADVSYTYRVRANDAAGNLSAYSNSTSNVPADCD